MDYFNSYLLPQNTNGFQNSGVICWFNSMLQTILTCTSVSKVFYENKNDIQTRNKLCQEFWNLIQEPSPEKSQTVLRAFMMQLHTKGHNVREMFGRGQEDANEGLLKFIDALEAPEIEYLFEHTYSSYIYCKECKFRKTITEKDVNICVEFDPSIKMVTTQNVLNQTSEIKDYKCDRCQETNTSVMLKRLYATPEILILIFKKYVGKTMVECPPEFQIPSMDPTKPYTYKLIGVNEHSGGQGGGHYWAVAKRRDGYYRLNDMSATKISDTGMSATPETYMAWYHIFSPPGEV
jgi:ubiquitin C-terminal hydrolase